MNDESFQLPSPLESDDLILTNAGRSSTSESDSAPAEAAKPASEKTIASAQPDGSMPSSHFPETVPSLSTGLEPSPMTAEVFASGALPPGTMLGHFVIKSFIGGGGMGRVYLASDTALDRNVAVKVLPRQRANDQGTVARFMNEARSAARLNHEHIAQVYFTGEQAGIPYIVFEYVEGTNIRALVDDFDAFPLPQALNYLIQIVHALAHAADHGVVHRDVKPSNILITREGRAKLIDMGLARLLDPSEAKDDLTASGVTLGTFDYISPEQARDPRNADIRSDIYSLGCTFFFMLSGRPPFPEGTVLQKLLQHQGDEPPDIRSFQPNVPTEVAMLLQKMMAKDPKQRYQTPGDLIEVLVHVAKTLGLQPTGPGKLNWVMTPPSRTSMLLKHVPWMAAVLVLLLAFLPLSMYWERQGTLTIPEIPPFELVDRKSAVPIGMFPAKEPAAPPGRLPEMERPPPYSGKASLEFASYPASRRDGAARPGFAPSSLFAGAWSEAESFGMRLIPAPSGKSWSPFESLRAAVGPAAPGGEEIRRDNGQATDAPEQAERPPICCVDPSGETPGFFPTLSAALASARSGATIELKWNGAMRVDPFVLAGQSLNFAAAAGFSPVLVFEPSDSTFSLPNSRSMMTIRLSRLTFRGVEIEMRIRQDEMGLQWSLFETIESNQIEFSRCVLTIQNAATDHSAYHQEVAFFRNESLPGGFDRIPQDFPSERFSGAGTFAGPSEREEPVDDDGRGRRLEIVLDRCLVRGEAVGLHSEIPQSVELRVAGSMLALARPLVLVADGPRTARSESTIRVALDSVTFYGRQAFARQIRDSFETGPTRLDIDAKSSIFLLNHTPLVEFQGFRSPDTIESSFSWTGEANDFQNVAFAWKLRSSQSSGDGGIAYEMLLPGWANRTQRSASIDRLRFDEIRKPMHRLLPVDLRPRFAFDDGSAAIPVPSGAREEQLPHPGKSKGTR